jgi:hypothetical protein
MRSELVTQKVERDIRIPALALSILAIDDFTFGGMHLQPALCQANLKLDLEGFGFLFGPAVHQAIVCISAPWEVGMRPPHPEV